MAATATVVSGRTGQPTQVFTRSSLTSSGNDEDVYVSPSTPQVQMLYQHYSTVKNTIERMASPDYDVHASYTERALHLLEVLVLGKEKGKAHFMNMTLGMPVLSNNPAFDPTGEGKRHSELPPTDDVAELVRRLLAELDHAMRLPAVPPGARALDVSKAAKLLKEAIVKKRETTTPQKHDHDHHHHEKKGASSACCSSTIPATEAPAKAKAKAPTAASGDCCSSSSKCDSGSSSSGTSLRNRRAAAHDHGHGNHGHDHKHGQCGGGDKASSLAAMLGAVLGFLKSQVSGKEAADAARARHVHAVGGGCCGGGAVGPSRMGHRQDGHEFMVGVLASVALLLVVLWWFS